MKKILIIQSRRRPEMLAAEQEEYRRAVGERTLVDFISSLDTTLTWNEPEKMLASYDGVIFGGSGEFDFDGGRTPDDVARITSREIVERVRPVVEWAMAEDFPLLGICYGHQIVSEVLGVAVVNDHEQKKMGTATVALTAEGKQDEVFGRLPETFTAQYGHKDSLSAVPEGAVVLASSPVCRAAALRYGKRVYTTQFHPELTREDMVWKLSNSPGYLPEGVAVESIVKDSTEASRIIPLFIELVVGK